MFRASRVEGPTGEELAEFFGRSLGGESLVARVPAALAWLTDPMRVLAFRDEHGRYRLTTLGLAATRAVLPLGMASGAAQLLRDLLSLDPTDRLLAGWRPLDNLIVLELLFDRRPKLRRFSAALVEQLDAWMRNVPDLASLLHEEWITGPQGTSRAGEVLGSLGIRPVRLRSDGDTWAHKEAYLAILRAVILHELSQGIAASELEHRWGVAGLSGAEVRWRDERLWLLAGLAQILDLRCFYFHLREECGAD